jgi:hypothetical protein
VDNSQFSLNWAAAIDCAKRYQFLPPKTEHELTVATPEDHKCVLAAMPPDTAVRSLIVVSDEPWLDQRALLRWADDGGRWVDASDGAIQEARI